MSHSGHRPQPRGTHPLDGQEEPPGMVSRWLRRNPMSWTPQKNKLFCLTQFSMLRPQTAFPGPSRGFGPAGPIPVPLSQEGRFTSPAPSCLWLPTQPSHSQPSQSPGKAEPCMPGRQGGVPCPPALQPQGVGWTSWQSRERCAKSRRAQPPQIGAGVGEEQAPPAHSTEKGPCLCTQGTNTRPTFVTRLIICGLHKRQMEQR